MGMARANVLGTSFVSCGIGEDSVWSLAAVTQIMGGGE